MTIEIKEKGTRSFYREVVNILTQYRQLLYAPGEKLRDNFMRTIMLTLAMAAILVMFLYGGITQGFSTSKVLAMVFSGLATVTTLIYLFRLEKMVNGYLADDHPSVVTIDESGVGIEKVGSQNVRLAWENVAFVRSFKESTSFFSGDLSGIVLSVTNDYRKEILNYIKNNGIDVKVIK